jgi:hypothetical protein
MDMLSFAESITDAEKKWKASRDPSGLEERFREELLTTVCGWTTNLAENSGGLLKVTVFKPLEIKYVGSGVRICMNIYTEHGKLCATADGMRAITLPLDREAFNNKVLEFMSIAVTKAISEKI